MSQCFMFVNSIAHHGFNYMPQNTISIFPLWSRSLDKTTVQMIESPFNLSMCSLLNIQFSVELPKAFEFQIYFVCNRILSYKSIMRSMNINTEYRLYFKCLFILCVDRTLRNIRNIVCTEKSVFSIFHGIFDNFQISSFFLVFWIIVLGTFIQ